MSHSWLALSARNSFAPFLYQTRTLSAFLNRQTSLRVRPYSTPKSSTPTADDDDVVSTQDSKDDKPPGPKPRTSYLQRRAASISQADPRVWPDPSDTPTLTHSEKQVFSELLEQFGADKPATPGLSADGTQSPQKWKSSSLSEESRIEIAQISSIFDTVLKDMRIRDHKPAGQVDDTARPIPASSKVASTDDAAAAVETRLRESNYDNAVISELLNSHKISMDRAITAVIKRESTKTETALQGAIDAGIGDNGVWEVCKERIFSMIRHLEDSPTTTTTSSSSSSSSSSSLPWVLEVPQGVPVEPVVATLYPKMLLVSFRLLNLHFPQSPVISQFRSTIKSHGRTSAVLGSSTELYNEMIYFYWRGCQDLPGVVSLLHEMEVTGVEPNQRTCMLLDGIVEQRSRDLKQHWRRMRGELHQPRNAWWDLAPNRKAMRALLVKDGWIDRLKSRVQEQQARKNTEWKMD
ncbi:hypothetical protein EYZ11_010849 [Aspergillus tanneri]|uniref:Mtf2-like C-terminal domain-containing protein n=1 Tax=Aspergillus tanneri TaxID=1220188 RepID=A0A4S3J6G2_9EURO|nr:uncharacterized protein ATNIH1004_002485 [Aspergillus tanneri]KAA8649808.1 hypothetical protein ATNIH1004_002485 [Aspergillus tanneri]THC89698.1 hypothetical protein EYZ11_010849 [Aspergillus tanneri]